MVFPEIFVSLIISVCLTCLYLLLTRRDGRRTGLIWLFLILFLATWAGGLWIRPFGPTLWGIRWLTYLLAGLFIFLLFVITAPRKAPRGRRDTLDMLERIEREKEMEKAAYITLGIFFWILLFVLAIAIILRHIIGVGLA